MNPRRITRRQLLQETALGAGALAVGAPYFFVRSAGIPANAGLETFEHVVVLMMENRSFDNMLGYLYGPGRLPRGQRFEGVEGKSLSNPIPRDADQAHRRVVPVAKGYVMHDPKPDPGEEYPHVNTQLFGTVRPASNRFKDAVSMAAPFNAPDPMPTRPPMNGFVADYIDNFHRLANRAPTYDEYAIIMRSFPPDAVPVISALAHGFAVCDHWHCAVPSQTFCNRAFFHAATSSGWVVNEPYARWVKQNTAETVFERLDGSWRIYYDLEDIVPLTVLIHFPRLRRYIETNVRPMADFYADVRSGNLPKYAFVEPRLFWKHNDEHPPSATFQLGKISVGAHSSVLAGEVLISEVYNAIRTAQSARGSNWQNTLFLITYDEHGGCYDHVPPPAAVPPDPGRPAGEMAFRFDRLGVRVPAVVISPYVEPGTVIRTSLDHNSVLRTFSEKWGIPPLTRRDRASPSLAGIFNRSIPRRPPTWPVTKPRPLPAVTNDRDPLNELQRAALHAVGALVGATDRALAEVGTIRQALQFIRRAVDSSAFKKEKTRD